MNTKKIINAIQNSKDFVLRNILNRFAKIIDINDLKDNESDKQTVEYPEWYLYDKNGDKTLFRIQEYDENGQQVDIIEKYKNKRSISLLNIKIQTFIAHTILNANIEPFTEAGIEYVSFQMSILDVNANVIYFLYNLRKENNEFLVNCKHIKIDIKILYIKFYEYQNNNWKLDVLNGSIGNIISADLIYLMDNAENSTSFIVLNKSYENKAPGKMSFKLMCKAIIETTQGIEEQNYIIGDYSEDGVDKLATTCGIARPY